MSAMSQEILREADESSPTAATGESIWSGTVLVVGPGRQTEGGITQVIDRIYACLESDPGIDATWISSHKSGGALGKARQALAGLVELLKRIGGADVVHIHSAAYVSFFRKSLYFWIARLRGKPVIWHLHSPDIDFADFFGRKGISGSYARWLLGKCSRVVVLSERWRKLADDAMPGIKTRVLYNPVPANDDRGAGSPPTQAQRILYLAHLIPRKGYSFLVRGFAAVADDYPDAELVFAGSGEVEEAKAICEELRILDRVTFLGWVGEPQRTEELCKAGIFVLPSYQEGLPMGVLEAMKFGLALVTTPVGGIPDVVVDGHNGLLIEPGNADAVAAALRELLGDVDLAKRLGTAARDAVTAFEPDRLADDWKRLYREVSQEEEARTKS